VIPIIAECAGEHQREGWKFREGTPSPLFPDLFLINDLADGGLVSAHSKGVVGANFEANGANLGSAHSNGLSRFWLIFTRNGTAKDEFSQ
jgi:hypothetical protein